MKEIKRVPVFLKHSVYTLQDQDRFGKIKLQTAPFPTISQLVRKTVSRVSSHDKVTSNNRAPVKPLMMPPQ